MNNKDTQHATRNTDAPASAQSQADAWFTPARFALLLTGIVLVRFPRVIFGRETFFYRDYGLFTYPVAHYFRECFWRGELPLWNPYNNFGVPFLAQWNTSVLYPPSLFFLLLPLTWSLAVFNLAHLVFAGMGMYFLARRWTGSQLAASIAGIAFAFNGLSLHMLMWISNLAAWAWMPWVVLTVEQAWNTASSFDVQHSMFDVRCYFIPTRPIALASLTGAMQMLSGAPELILLTWLFLGALWLVQFCRAKSSRGKMFWRVAAIGILIAGLSAAQLLPFMELLKHSQRDTSFGDSKWAMPVWGWANFLVPLFHCSPSIIGIYSQTEQQWTSSYYMGIGVAALAVIAVWRQRDLRVYGLALAVLAGIVLSMGENAPIYGWVKRAFPLLGIMRYPIKLVVLSVFALPLLAAFAIAGKARDEAHPTETHERNTHLPFLATGFFVLIAVAVILAFAHRFPLADESWKVTLQSGSSRVIFLVAVLATAWAVVRSTSARTVGLSGAMMLLLIAFDALTHTPNQNPTLPVAIYEPLEAGFPGRARLGESRAMLHPQMQAFLFHAATPNSLNYYLGMRQMLFLNCNLVDDIPSTSGFFSLELLSAARATAVLSSSKVPIPNPLMDFVGVSRISSPNADFSWTNHEGFRPIVAGGQLPRFYLTRYQFQQDWLWGRLISPEFDPRSTVYLPDTLQKTVAGFSATTVRITNQKILPHRDEFDTQSDAPAIVTIAQAFYPAWHAYVDGQRVPLWEANGAFQALAVPAGQHHVKVIYEDRKFQIGAIISGGSLLILGIMWFVGRKQA